jgi:hypothetical protein
VAKNDFTPSITGHQQTAHDSPTDRLIKIGKLVLVFASSFSGLIQVHILQEIHMTQALDYLYVDYLLSGLNAGLVEPLVMI